MTTLHKEEQKLQPGIEPEGDLLTVEQVATWLQVNKNTIYRKKKQFGARKVVGAIRIPKANVLQMLKDEQLEQNED
jgi:hypothetical protein